jgi:aldose 1-epimerase
MKPLNRSHFQGQLQGQALDLFELSNGQGLQVSISNYGGRILQVLTPDRWGALDDVVLGYHCLDDMLAAKSSVGALIGRYAGRIGQAQFNWEQQTYSLSANDGPHCLHGGVEGLRFRVFEVTNVQSDRLQLHYCFADGEMGFPGKLWLNLEYRVTPQGALEIEYELLAQDKPSLASLTTHAYFNLNGCAMGSAMDHEVIIHSEQYFEVDPSLVATGRLLPTHETRFDLNQRVQLSEHLSRWQMTGFDDCFLVRQTTLDSYQKADSDLVLCAELFAPRYGRSMRVLSNEPALQFYTGLDPQAPIGKGIGKEGRFYRQQEGLCFEPQAYPNAPNCPAFPLPLIEPGVPKKGKTVYVFNTF